MSEAPKKQTFLHGTALLALATAIVKVIGALYKLPLNAIIGEQGFSYFNTAYEIYTVLLLISTVKSGKTISRMLECMEYYGASVQGIATVFSTAESLDGIPVYSLFTPDDLPGYISRDAKECPMCKEGQKITAIANSYGLSKL